MLEKMHACMLILLLFVLTSMSWFTHSCLFAKR